MAKVPLLRMEIVKRSDNMKGFVILPRRSWPPYTESTPRRSGTAGSLRRSEIQRYQNPMRGMIVHEPLACAEKWGRRSEKGWNRQRSVLSIGTACSAGDTWDCND